MRERPRSRFPHSGGVILALLAVVASLPLPAAGIDSDGNARDRGRIPRGNRTRSTLLLPGGNGALPILPPGGPRAADGLDATPACDPQVINKGEALLEWQLAEEPGQQQFVQVTIFREGFDSGSYILSRPLPPDQTSLVFTQIAGQALHRWRVLTQHPDGFVPSETVTFTGPICVFDEGREENGNDIPQ